MVDITAAPTEAGAGAPEVETLSCDIDTFIDVVSAILLDEDDSSSAISRLPETRARQIALRMFLALQGGDH